MLLRTVSRGRNRVYINANYQRERKRERERGGRKGPRSFFFAFFFLRRKSGIFVTTCQDVPANRITRASINFSGSKGKRIEMEERSITIDRSTAR